MGCDRRIFGALAASLTILASCGSNDAAHHPSAAPAAVAKLIAATVTISLPIRPTAAGRRAAYIPVAAKSIAISSYAVIGGTIASTPAATSAQDLTAAAPGCSTTTTQLFCAVTIAAPLGTVAFDATLYAGLGETGAVLSQLVHSVATERTIAEGQTNVTLALVLDGVPASVLITPATTTLTAGVSATIPLAVVVSDASGALILGAEPYAQPIALTDSDTSGATSLSTATVTSPATSVSLAYNGAGLASPVTIGGSASGATVTPGTLTYVPGSLTASCSPSCSSLSNPNTPYAETISESGYGSGQFTFTSGGTACTFEPTGTVTASNGAAIVNVFPNPQGGTCTMSVSDSYAQTASVSLGFASAGDPVVSSHALSGYPTIPADSNNGGLKFTVDCCPDPSPPAYPILLWGAYTYWPASYNTNPNALGIIIYGSPSDPVTVIDNVNGTRYIGSITVNSGLQTVTFSGQGGTTATLTYAQLVP